MASQGAHPACLFLTLTLLVTMTASVILVTAIITTHWEELSFQRKIVEEITASKNHTHKLTWLMKGKVAKIDILQTSSRVAESNAPSDFEESLWETAKAERVRRPRREATRVIFLVPLHGGIWTLCVGVEGTEQITLTSLGYPLRGCISFLEEGSRNFGAAGQNEWIQRMQNLSISCSFVCCIILGASALVGCFGITQRQISAVLITGVMYILATTFGLFFLSIMHFKMKTKIEYGLVDPQITIEYASARVFESGWSLQMGWVGVVTCMGAALLWLLLAKVMRYNPISLS